MRIDNENPSFTNVSYDQKKTRGTNAIKLYRSTGQQLLTWQQRQIKAIEATNKDGLWKHMTYCICVSRQDKICRREQMDAEYHLRLHSWRKADS